MFDSLIKEINEKIGKCEVVSILCCIHLFGKYDFLAILPKKDRLEIRFALDRQLKSTRIKQCVSMSKKVYKNRIDKYLKEEIDKELVGWLNQSFYLKDKK